MAKKVKTAVKAVSPKQSIITTRKKTSKELR